MLSRNRSPSGVGLREQFFGQLDFVSASNVERHLLVDIFWDNIKYPVFSVGSQAASDADNEGQRVGFIGKPQFALRVILVSGIHEYSALQQCPMKI